ncbi:hypothetical protein C7B61_02300 [filamentous cyanobacterium CCP1]|nr:hypothetical protein C7B76_12215 [filamentous cyanobacterium CCP2]PSB68162.1 hypothetical protein C7B61_02300 [filamentous cyanobacterium CCP1]
MVLDLGFVRDVVTNERFLLASNLEFVYPYAVIGKVAVLVVGSLVFLRLDHLAQRVFKPSGLPLRILPGLPFLSIRSTAERWLSNAECACAGTVASLLFIRTCL